MTVALFIKAGEGAQGGDRVFTNNLVDPTKSFQIVIGNNGLVLAVDPNETGELAERTLYLEDNSGHDPRFLRRHPAGSTWSRRQRRGRAERASNLKIWVNGVNRTENLTPNVVGWGTDTGMVKIGGRRETPRTRPRTRWARRSFHLAQSCAYRGRSPKSMASRPYSANNGNGIR